MWVEACNIILSTFPVLWLNSRLQACQSNPFHYHNIHPQKNLQEFSLACVALGKTGPLKAMGEDDAVPDSESKQFLARAASHQ